MDLHVFGQVSRAIDEHFRERALAPVLVSVRNEERVLGELSSPCDDDGLQTVRSFS